ncbi:hypothetical protein HOLleu_05523 [Holothuria leucospilota]|uniref:RRM domain-containing protein n=1 Tax=Holothuria leucospilota TaxID=206669 RepID=A0A9Q1CLS2_HOLLE|nr:hypothetical protein HOLleu_05523 [Holothuria leucospilota]
MILLEVTGMKKSTGMITEGTMTKMVEEEDTMMMAAGMMMKTVVKGDGGEGGGSKDRMIESKKLTASWDKIICVGRCAWRDRRDDRPRHPPEKPCRVIVLRQLPLSVDEDEIRAVLQIFGAPIKDVRLVRHKETGKARTATLYPLCPMGFSRVSVHWQETTWEV